MKFPCPECGKGQQVDPLVALHDGTSPTCRSCTARIAIQGPFSVRNDFDGRIVHCAACGKEFPFAPACPACKARFSGFVYVIPERSPQAGRFVAAWQPMTSGRGAMGMMDRIRSTSPVLRIGVLLLAVMLLAAGIAGWFRHRQHAEHAFLVNYVQAVYGIKSGFDRGTNLSRNFLSEWRRNRTLGIARPDQDAEELADLETVKKEVDKVMGQLAEPPEPLREAIGPLEQLYAVYERQNALALNPPGSPDVYDRALQATQSDFEKALRELKTAMPAPLQEQVKKDAGKYYLDFLE